MISRLGSEYFMPACPMAMPSSTPMVLKMNGTPPAWRTHSLHELADLVQVDVAGNDVHVAIADGDEGLLEIAVPQPGGAEEASMGGPGVAQLDRVRSHVFLVLSEAKSSLR